MVIILRMQLKDQQGGALVLLAMASSVTVHLSTHRLLEVLGDVFLRLVDVCLPRTSMGFLVFPFVVAQTEATSTCWLLKYLKKTIMLPFGFLSYQVNIHNLLSDSPYEMVSIFPLPFPWSFFVLAL